MKRLREEWSESIFVSGGLYENLRFYEFRKLNQRQARMNIEEEKKGDPDDRPK